MGVEGNMIDYKITPVNKIEKEHIFEKIPYFMLEDWLKQSLEWKIKRTNIRIKEFYKEMDGKVYISFSGGKDSTVLLNLVRKIYPDVEGVYVNTGLEYPEINNFIKKMDNIKVIRPKKSFVEVINKYGYPVISKVVSHAINRYRNTSNKENKQFRLYGWKKDRGKLVLGVIPRKYAYLINAPFKISDQCCDIMKKYPFKKYVKETNNYPFIGTMATDSNLRLRNFLERGCNVYYKNIQSRPLSFWTQDDIWRYIRMNDIPYSKIYDMGEKHTGCIFCMFGCHLEEHPNRFRRMKTHHPELWRYCMYKLNLKRVLRYMGLDSGINILDDCFLKGGKQ